MSDAADISRNVDLVGRFSRYTALQHELIHFCHEMSTVSLVSRWLMRCVVVQARQRDASVSQESVQQSTAVSQLQQQLQQSSQQLQQLAADHAAAQSRLKHADEQLAQLGSELERVEAAAAAVRSELDEARTTTAQTGSELATAQAGLRAKDEEMERRAVELADVTGQLDSSAASNGAVQTQLDEALGRVREALQEGELQKTVRGELEAETQQVWCSSLSHCVTGRVHLSSCTSSTLLVNSLGISNVMAISPF